MGVKRSRSDSVSSSDPASPFSREASADVKIVHLDVDTTVSHKPAVMKCSLPPHAPLTFASFEEYDVHYQKTHMNRCSECHKNFPDEHFLSLHIAENHDPITAAKKDRGEKTYACLLPTCDRHCSTPQKRRLHCIDKHNFPRNYDFFIVNDGVDRRSSMLRPPHRRRSSTINSTTGNGSHRRRSSTLKSTAESSKTVRADGESMDVVNVDEESENEEDEDEEMEDGKGTPKSPQRAPIKLRGRGGFGRRGRGRGTSQGSALDTTVAAPTTSTKASSAASDPMENLTSSMSALKFVPHSVRLASGRGRGST